MYFVFSFVILEAYFDVLYLALLLIKMILYILCCFLENSYRTKVIALYCHRN